MTTSKRRDPVARTAQIVRLLKARPRTSKELAEIMRIGTTSVDRHLRALRGTRAHVADWSLVSTANYSCYAALWAAGPGKDALRPPPRFHNRRDQDVDSLDPRRLAAQRQESVRHATALAAELRKLPARSPLEACVSAALYAEHREGL